MASGTLADDHLANDFQFIILTAYETLGSLMIVGTADKSVIISYETA